MTVTIRIDVPWALLVWRESGRKKLAEEGRCRMCLRPSSIRPLTRHHLVKQTWFRSRAFVLHRPERGFPLERYEVRDCDANIIPLCAPCHVEVERDPSARVMLRKLLSSAEVSLAIRLRGVTWFNSQYPEAERRHAKKQVA